MTLYIADSRKPTTDKHISLFTFSMRSKAKMYGSPIDQFKCRLKKKVKAIESDMKYSFVRCGMAIMFEKKTHTQRATKFNGIIDF